MSLSNFHPIRLFHGYAPIRRCLLLVLLVVVTHLQIQITHAAGAPYFSYLFPSSSSEGEDGVKAGTTTETNSETDGLLVSPIVNREIQVSVAAHSWPSTPHNVICEAWAMVQDYNFLDQWVTELAKQHEQQHDEGVLDYRQLTKQAVRIAAETSSSTVYPPLMEYALVLRASSPTCEMHRGLAQETLKQFQVLPTASNTCANDMGQTNMNAFAVLYPGGKLALTIDELVPPGELNDEATTTDLSRDVLLPDEVPRETENNSNRDDLLVVLYANMADPMFAEFYQRLVQLDFPFVVRHLGDVATMVGAKSSGDDSDNVCASPSNNENSGAITSSPTILQGYGVRLDIRNVEYKVFDDRQQVDNADVELVNVSALEKLTPHYLAGVNLTALPKEQALLDEEKVASETGEDENPTTKEGTESPSFLQLQEKLWKIHVENEIHTQLVPPSWQRRQLSLQAASSIVTESSKGQHASSTSRMDASHDPLVLLQDISQNLPSVASTLVHVSVDPDLEGIAIELEQVLQSMIRSGGGGFWINGRPVGVERPSFNVFELIKLFQAEQEHLDRLETSLGPVLVGASTVEEHQAFQHTDASVAALEAIQQAWTQGEAFFEPIDDDAADDLVDDDDDDNTEKSMSSGGKFRIDVGRGWKQAVLYINDVEKDAQYQDWPRSMQQMLMAMQFGMPPRVRRNVFTVLAVVDPASRQDGEEPNPGKKLAGQLLQNQYPVRLGLLIVSKADIDACSEWMSTAKPDEDEPCPKREVDAFLDFERATTSSIPTTEQLQEMPATARVAHRLLAHTSSEYPSHIVGAYQEYLSASISQSFQQKRADVERLSVFDLIRIHVQLLQALQVVDSLSVSEVVRALLDMEEENRDNISDGDSKDLSYLKAVRFAVDKGLKPGMSFLNGIPLPDSSDDSADEKLGEAFMNEQNHIFKMIMKNEITDSAPRSIYGKLLSGGRVFPKVHPLLSDTSSEVRYLEVIHKYGPDSLLFVTESAAETASSTPPSTDVDAVFVIEAVLDFDTDTGLQIASKLVTILESFPTTIGKDSIAIGYRIIPSSESAAKAPLCPLLAGLGRVGSTYIQELLSNSGNAATLLELAESLGVKVNDSDRKACLDMSHLKKGIPYANFFVANGRVLPIQGTSVDKVDIELLLSIDIGRSKTVTKLLTPYLTSPNVSFDAIAKTTSFLSVSALDAKEKRSSPLADLKAIEKQIGLEVDNPLRFSWNLSEVKQGKVLKVSNSFCPCNRAKNSSLLSMCILTSLCFRRWESWQLWIL